MDANNNVKLNLLKPLDNLIYNRNIAALKEAYPQYAKAIEDIPIGKDYIAVATGSKEIFNVFCLKNESFYYNFEDIDADVIKQYTELKIVNARIALFLGFGLGYEVDYFAKYISEKQKTQRIIIIEKDIELFKIALQYIDYTPMIKDSNISLILGENIENIFTCLVNVYTKNASMVYYVKCIQPVYHESSIKNNNEYYMEVLTILRKSVSYMMDYFGNDPHDSLIGFDNIMDNIGEIVKNPGINLLFNKFKGKPAVIVSTGPSLNKNKHLLKGLQDKAFIICPDASLKILLEMGVKPHLVTALERTELTTSLIAGFTKEEVEDVYYAATPVVLPKAYELYPGPRLIVYRKFDHFKWIGIDRGICEIKHSAGNMAFKLAEVMACDPIILIGQDLAYSRDGKTHAAGAVLGENQVKSDKDNFEVMGNDGQPIMTNSTWNLFRQGFEIDIADSKSRCINSTEGGAFIEGTTVMSFEKAIELYIAEEFYPVKLIKEQLAEFSNHNTKHDVDTLIKIIDKTVVDIKDMMGSCLKGLDGINANKELYEKILNSKTKVKVGKSFGNNFNKNIGYKGKIIHNDPTMQLFLMHIVQPFTIKFEIDLNVLPGLYEDKNKIFAANMLMHHKWYAVMHDMMGICLNSLEKARNSVIDIKFDEEK